MSQLQQVQRTYSAVICEELAASHQYNEHGFVLGTPYQVRLLLCPYYLACMPQLFLNEEHRVFWGPSSACHTVILSFYLGYERDIHLLVQMITQTRLSTTTCKVNKKFSG